MNKKTLAQFNAALATANTAIDELVMLIPALEYEGLCNRGVKYARRLQFLKDRIDLCMVVASPKHVREILNRIDHREKL